MVVGDAELVDRRLQVGQVLRVHLVVLELVLQPLDDADGRREVVDTAARPERGLACMRTHPQKTVVNCVFFIVSEVRARVDRPQ